MNYTEMLDELRQEKDLVEHAILVLERMQVGAPRRRGRPPAWLTERKKEVIGGAVAGAGGMDAASGVDAPPKRKRGRPRKNPLPAE